jgi:amino acid adenylation domain-containing protein
MANSTAVSFAQERLWFLNQINPEDAATVARAVTITGPLQRDVLERCLQLLVSRHESLRTTFATTQLYAGIDSKPVQLVADAGTFPLETVDISGTPAAEGEARRLAQEKVRHKFDLSLGPLIRATSIRLDRQSHVLLITAHRIIADEESLNTLFRELWKVYAAGGNLEPAQLSPLPVQYTGFATRQLQDLEGEAGVSAIDYWRERLAGAPPAVELPGHRTGAAPGTPAGATILSGLDQALAGALQALADREETTLRTVLLAAFAVLLSRYSTQRDLVVGLEVTNRDEHTCNLVGPVSNLLPLRLDPEPRESFIDLLHRLEELVFADEKRAVPFEKLLQELNVERSLSRPPLVQITFDFRITCETNLRVDALYIEDFALEANLNDFELTLDIVKASEQLDCRFGYNAALYDTALIRSLAGHFQILLRGIVSNPLQMISALPLLSGPEREQVLVEWNRTDAGYPREQCIHELFAAQAERTPTGIAVVDEKQRLSYEELERRANRLAWRLRREGVGCESLVAVCMERSVDLVVALLGILKAGGAYVPLDPSYPQPRLRFMLEDTQAEVVLTEQHLATRLPQASGKRILLDQEREQLGQESGERVPRLSEPESLGYVIYTSGSTGRPKGVAIEHRSTVALLQWAQSVYGPKELSAVLASTSVCFDLSVYELFLPLSVGGTVVIAEDALQLASGKWGVELSLINTVPSAMAEVLRLECIPPSVRVVNLAGEPLPQTLVQQLYEQGGIERVYDLYGPTEDTTYSTFALRSGLEAATIGRPVANTQVYLLDALLQPVPVGVPGELYLGGAGLARGYLKRPELTAEKFIPNPYGEAGTRLYKTGDVARYQADGKLQYLGRGDQQVKVRGYRIELGEIEAALREHPSIRDVTVAVHERRLVAYIVRSSQLTNGRPLTTTLREFVTSKLPEYMAPAFFLELDQLPLTANGKLDRRALPAPEAVHADSSKERVAPRNKVEEQLASLWAKVLQLKTAGVTDNFFELGGDSLLAARLFAQIHNRFGKNLPLSTLFVSPTIELLANTLREGEAGDRWSSLVPIQPHGSKPPLFCVHAAGANVLIYRPMSRHLGHDQPVYALQAQGLDGSEPFRRVEDMAAHYLREVRAFQPHGPYYLLGASFGGLVIYEMAQQLLAQGEQVAFLGMLNTNYPVYSLRKRLGCHLGHLKQRGVRNYALGLSQSLKRRLNRPAAPEVEVQTVVQDQEDEALVRTVAAILEAEQNYVPSNRRYPGKITFFWADDAPRDFEDNRLAWTKIAAGGCEIHIVPGTHTKMREEPHVQKLVEKLRPALERARVLSV